MTMSDAKPVLFAARGACSLAVHAALRESGIAHEVRFIDFSSDEQRSSGYLSVNSKGRVPALMCGEFVLTEAPAILRYVARLSTAAALWPEGEEDEGRCMEWLAWISSTVHPAYAHVHRPYRYANSADARTDVSAKGSETCRQLWTDVEEKLRGREWAVGDRFSVVDCYLLVFWTWGRGHGLRYDMERDFPSWTAHARRMSARPAVRATLELEGIAIP